MPPALPGLWEWIPRLLVPLDSEPNETSNVLRSPRRGGKGSGHLGEGKGRGGEARRGKGVGGGEAPFCVLRFQARLMVTVKWRGAGCPFSLAL